MDQFLDVIDRDEAEARFHAAVRLEPLGEETVPLSEALGRVLSRDVVAPVNVPSFDRSNYDGYAVRAADTYGASEESPHALRLASDEAVMGVLPEGEVEAGSARAIATGGPLPRGADAIVMVEHADIEGIELLVRKEVTPGFGVAFAGSDLAAGETALRRGDLVTSRETGVLAAVGCDRVEVFSRPRVAIISTGDELIGPGEPMSPGKVYDSNARILADAVRELGGEPIELGIVPDEIDALRERLGEALRRSDIVLLSGGTSKGAGDLSYRVVSELDDPGIVAHGVALKPGKPICLAASGGKPVVILPGFPTSAIFTFHEFVAPVVCRLAGRSAEDRRTLPARMAVKVNSEIGRTEYLLVSLVEGAECPVAWPLGKGSGSVTAFSRADGFVTIGRHEEIVEAGADVAVQLLGRDLRPADLVVIGSHCVGLDWLLSQLQMQGFSTKLLAAGSTAGLEAARRGECDLAGIHLLDPETGAYNRPFVDDRLELLPGYGRRQGIVYRQGDPRFEGHPAADAVQAAIDDPKCVMVGRNQGSGTRILLDGLLAGAQPPGYAVQARSHTAVAAAVAQGRADWGLAIENVARDQGLGFLPHQDEQYDFVVPKSHLDRPAVQEFRRILDAPQTHQQLGRMGFAI